ncbi:MAG: amidohydrolase family protein [Acidimicrobiia bacterium]
MTATVQTHRDYRLISADSHLTEPGDLWTSRVDAKFRDRVPRIERFDEGHAWVMEGVPNPIAFGFTVCAGNKPEDLRDWMFLEEMRAGGWDPAVRLEEQDEDDVDAEVLFPNRPHQAVIANKDADLHHAMVRAYNDWLSEYCSHAPDRLGGVAMLPNRGVAEAVDEFHRIREMPGFVSVLLSCYPHGDTKISRDDDPLWEAIEASGVPVSIHIRLDDTMPFQLQARKLPGTVHFYDAPSRMLEIIFAGVLDRFPRLQFVLAEVDCGWMPYFAEQADDNYHRHAKATLRGQELAHLPSWYMKNHFNATYVCDPSGLTNRHRVGVDRMMWSSDYPHITSDWPNSWRTVGQSFANIPDDERHAILAGNAERIFGFHR